MGEATIPAYQIPAQIDKGIPEHFYIALEGEITSVFGKDVWWCADGLHGEDYIGGTAGYAAALKMTCWKLGMMWLYEYYENLAWYESDQFDGIVLDRVKEHIIHENEDGVNAYYLYLIQEKEW